jgi:hypothetical protein
MVRRDHENGEEGLVGRGSCWGGCKVRVA